MNAVCLCPPSCSGGSPVTVTQFRNKQPTYDYSKFLNWEVSTYLCYHTHSIGQFLYYPRNRLFWIAVVAMEMVVPAELVFMMTPKNFLTC